MQRAREALVEPWVLGFPYTRTTGPVVGRFLRGLEQRRIEGLRARDGSVFVPPTGYHPVTAEALSDWVEVGQEGTLTGYAWVPKPLPTHPSSLPFAWGMVQLDGATSSLVHVLFAAEEQLKTGLRVRVRWAEERTGHILDIAGFEPVHGGATA